MAKIFISYRRDDSAYPAQMIHKDLTIHFGIESVVLDVDTIPPGVNFREYLNRQVSECNILLAIIGDQWINILNQRLDEKDDFVRIEIQAALKRQIPVVPILVGKASVPSENNLPPELVGLSNKQAIQVRAGADLASHIKQLIAGLERLLAEQKAEEERRRKEAEAKQKAEEERRRKEAEAKRKEKRRSDVAEENPYISRIKKHHLFLLVLSVIIVTAVFTCIKIKSEQTRQLSEQARQLSEQARRGFIAFQSSLTNSIGMKFVDIPPGSYKMGSKLSAEEIAKKYGGEVEHRKNEHPRHDVKISEAFYLQTTEVTQGQWKKVMGDNPSNFKDCGDDCPVENVSWNEVKDFIKKLNEMEEGSRYRLPTEAEWEYAARAGTETAFSFGNDPNKIDDYAWWSYNSGGKIHPVGQKNPNAWGLYDMHGNVEEWVEDDDHDNYEGAPDDGRAWVDDPRAYYRVIRGGSYAHRDRNCRSASRWGGHPGWLFSDKDPYIYRGIGFRLSRSVPLGGEAK